MKIIISYKQDTKVYNLDQSLPVHDTFEAVRAFATSAFDGLPEELVFSYACPTGNLLIADPHGWKVVMKKVKNLDSCTLTIMEQEVSSDEESYEMVSTTQGVISGSESENSDDEIQIEGKTETEPEPVKETKTKEPEKEIEDKQEKAEEPKSCCQKAKEFVEEIGMENIKTFIIVFHSLLQDGSDVTSAFHSALATCDNIGEHAFIKEMLPKIDAMLPKAEPFVHMIRTINLDMIFSMLPNLMRMGRQFEQQQGEQHHEVDLRPLFSMMNPGMIQQLESMIPNGEERVFHINPLNPFGVLQEAERHLQAEQQNQVHYGVICDGCEMNPIVGTRWNCTVRPDFDLCNTCREKEGTAIPMNEIKHPKQFAQSGQQTSQETANDNDNTHHGITCDGCGMYPIVGTRYKCAVRPDYDLCENCYESEDKSIPMIALRQPLKDAKRFHGLHEFARKHGMGRGRGRGHCHGRGRGRGRGRGCIFRRHYDDRDRREEREDHRFGRDCRFNRPNRGCPWKHASEEQKMAWKEMKQNWCKQNKAHKEAWKNQCEEHKKAWKEMKQNWCHQNQEHKEAWKEMKKNWCNQWKNFQPSEEQKEAWKKCKESWKEKKAFWKNATPEERQAMKEKWGRWGCKKQSNEDLHAKKTAAKADLKEKQCKIRALKREAKECKKQLKGLKKQCKAERKAEKKAFKQAQKKDAYAARIVAHLDTEEKSVQQGGALVFKTWKVENTGSKLWSNIHADFVKGNSTMITQGYESLKVEETAPNGAAYIHTMLQVPQTPGRYVVVYRLINENGKPFGQRLKCVIFVNENNEKTIIDKADPCKKIEPVVEEPIKIVQNVINDFVGAATEVVEQVKQAIVPEPKLDQNVEQLINMGFPKDDCIKMMKECGDMYVAMEKLLAQQQEPAVPVVQQVISEPVPVEQIIQEVPEKEIELEEEEESEVGQIADYESDTEKSAIEDVYVEPLREEADTFVFPKQLEQLRMMGFEAEACKKALIVSEGNIEQAANMLLHNLA